MTPRATGSKQRQSAVVEATVANGCYVLSGDLLIETIDRLDHDLRGARLIDISQVAQLDTAGAWFILDLERRIADADKGRLIRGATDTQRQLLDTVRASMPTEAEITEHRPTITDRIEAIGRATANAGRVALELTSFLGEVIAVMGRLIVQPRRFRMTSLVYHMQQVGWNAIPIVALMAFLIGVVLAFQGATQLRQFGAEVFVVDLIAISVLRELGILLTAIIVAGRSGSAFTAAIGSMKMREEIDAMRTLGLNPMEILVVPRILALVLMLPVLGLIADVSGLIGGAIMSWIELGVSPAVFQSRLVSNTDVWHFGVGMIKAPFFALIIGIIGCYEGMKVGGDAESLGRLTSTSVVLAIFMVIVVDAIFSIFFSLVGV
ncbi:ABC transporter permease [Pontibaca salina]|uniref:MlaE family lipid ABC transporter permease subunit n=1 Tax=Pontibaca salina TaxID=2795731 RepID=A0A934HVA1_9RHOB|nr:MlaE family lipid ABC transporter permease subunit [Pontibaca salina]MBI6630908.1 MlaE family lipid ABC transporter permease subunit [Pontibaca salina]